MPQVPFSVREGAAQNLDVEEVGEEADARGSPIGARHICFILSLVNKYNITSDDSHSPDSVYSLALGLSALPSSTAPLRKAFALVFDPGAAVRKAPRSPSMLISGALPEPTVERSSPLVILTNVVESNHQPPQESHRKEKFKLQFVHNYYHNGL
jgi:hypothetical protein